MKHKCPLCPKEYQSINDLDAHLKKIHGLSPVAFRNIPESEKSEFIKKCLTVLKEIEEHKLKQKG